MAKLQYTIKSEHVNVEGKFKLSISRERNDIKSLLQELKKGKKLIDIFKSKSIANAILKLLQDKNLIDSNQSVTSDGEEMIKSPFFEEEEKGTYSIDFNTILLDNYYSIITNIKRKISNERRELSIFKIRDIVKGNQIVLDNSLIEITFFNALDSYGEKGTRVMSANPIEGNVSFDIIEQTYRFGEKWLKCGTNLINKIKEKAKQELSNNPYGTFNLDEQKLVINNLKDFTEKDLINGKLTQYIHNGIHAQDFSITIKTYQQAEEYAYLYAYYKLKDNEYLSFSELDEMFQNEILTNDIFAANVKKDIATFSYSMDGFKRFLSKEKYDKLSYKLEILKYLLDLKFENNEFSSAKNYKDLTKLFKQQIKPDSVNHVYLIMGYPFVKNNNNPNKMKEAIQNLKTCYEDITIVQKGTQKKDKIVEKEVLDIGIKTIEKPGIQQAFHDRYIIFALKNNTYITYLVTCEYGQFFNQNNEQLGAIIKVDPKELKKGNIDLLKIIRG